MSTNRLFLSFVLSLALIVIPLSSITLQAAGSQQQYGNQPDPSRNQNMEQNQGQDRDQNLNQSQRTTGQTGEDVDTSDEALPSTAGELPLLALIGILSLIGATGLGLVQARQRR